ncbi:NADH-quinone oxidoreductase subunit J [Yinghuangia sp. ASG 101]|uniref:NADH-quinone oxidoreductase subunit J n=1 Tax=Yinghuangia sp. ASG 101 TaxID=2896848 RepID=UPI001E55ED39|nr:NADH-quinone oxidoreductase subunit J [Yinghuangia sp. ASG 101]UGQ14700.1 NADH-quinone oxidoreductase subunit J [Yinghuangia sp. ASG 101]
MTAATDGLSGGVVLAEQLTRTSTGEAVQFWILATIALIGALGTVFMKKAVHSALMLAATMLCLAFFYMAQGAVFLGIVQIVVYTGAIMMLFLFVLMLVGVSSADSLKETLRGQRVAAALAGLGFGILLIAGIANAALGDFAGFGGGTSPSGVVETDPAVVAAMRENRNVDGLAHLIFTRYVWAFEVTSALLITAALGAMVLAHRERLTPRKTQRELADERVRENVNLAPLPAPGVYARHNAVDIPALLPDGTVSELSVNATLRARGQVRDVSREPVHRVAELEEHAEVWMEQRGDVPPARRDGEEGTGTPDGPAAGGPGPDGGDAGDGTRDGTSPGEGAPGVDPDRAGAERTDGDSVAAGAGSKESKGSLS